MATHAKQITPGTFLGKTTFSGFSAKTLPTDVKNSFLKTMTGKGFESEDGEIFVVTLLYSIALATPCVTLLRRGKVETTITAVYVKENLPNKFIMTVNHIDAKKLTHMKFISPEIDETNTRSMQLNIDAKYQKSLMTLGFIELDDTVLTTDLSDVDLYLRRYPALTYSILAGNLAYSYLPAIATILELYHKNLLSNTTFDFIKVK